MISKFQYNYDINALIAGWDNMKERVIGFELPLTDIDTLQDTIKLLLIDILEGFENKFEEKIRQQS
ncbi:hypothetical protein GCM10028868_16960 [Virgibacillus kimchii]